ncbi:MAG: hypothetical protein NZ898_11420 [Myxococcota bacterium]|nr:hypothetical protein [Myxococcota bacterium]
MTASRIPRSLVLLVVLAVPGGLVPAARSSAQTSRAHAESVHVDVHLDLGGWHGTFGVGARADVPVVPDGLLETPDVPDSLVVSAGAELLFWDYYQHHHESDFGIAPLVAAQWNFYVSDRWSLLAELGIAILFGDYWHHHHHHRHDDDHPHAHAHIYPDVFLGLGARYHFGSRNALLLRVSWPAGLQVGLVF